MKYLLPFALLGTLLASVPLRPKLQPKAAFQGRVTQGALLALDSAGKPATECPLKHTDVKADITGFVARVTVTQEFRNDSERKIEAVYVFPLSQNSAVDDMTMLVGTRKVKGTIKRREEARAIYEAAKSAGHVASLLDQERPNIFTQSVANIMPGEQVKIIISYVEHLKYEDGTYEFVFPMVVGPRYIPGTPTGKVGGGWAPDTDRVPDASKITPPVAVPGTRAGHDIDVQVSIDAGLPIESVKATTHEIDIQRPVNSKAVASLKDKATLPNKDFILRYDVAGRKIQDTLLAHRGANGGYFSLIVQPPDRPAAADISPKELVFVLDTSGSMHGFPIDKAKESMRYAIQNLNPQDTFNLITFAGDTRVLWPKPVPATQQNIQQAVQFMDSHTGSGGTEMMKAIKAALDGSGSQSSVRVVCFMTDGYVGNDAEIIREIQQHSNARVFSFGIGSAVNRYLLDKMAEVGRGEVEYVGLNDDGSAAAKRFYERVRNPLLTDITVEWNGLPVSEVYPQRVPDLFSAKPVVLTGRYNGAASGTVRIRGNLQGRPIVRDLPVNLPAAEANHQVLASLWARRKVDHLMHERGTDIQEQITQIGLNYRLMTPFTSFVAVEEMTVTDGGKPVRIDVPVEIPEGVSYEGIFGNGAEMRAFAPMAQSKAMAVMPAPANGAGLGGGVYRNRAVQADMAMESAQRLPANKLDPALAGKTGVLNVQIWLSDTGAEAMAKLKAAGVTVLAQPKSGKSVIAKVDASKLEALKQMTFVTYISLMK